MVLGHAKGSNCLQGKVLPRVHVYLQNAPLHHSGRHRWILRDLVPAASANTLQGYPCASSRML